VNGLPFIELWHFLAVMAALVITSIIAHKTEGKRHQLFLIGLSVAFILFLDATSGIILIVYSHFAYYLLSYHTKNSTLLRYAAWGSVAALILFKGIQVYVLDSGGFGLIYLIGVSYYVFRISSTLFDCAKLGRFQGGYLSYINYCLFFPLFTGGPVERYDGFLPNDNPWGQNCTIGMRRIMQGIIKKLFIADVFLLEVLYYLKDWAGKLPTDAARPVIFTAETQQPQIALFLFGAVSIVRAYMDLSAFTDLAVGGSRIMGYTVSENFNKPLRATNLIDFWRRWHMTIAGWAKDYIFSPMLLGTRKIALSIIVTMLFMGIWHAPTLSWVFWGLGHGLGMLVFGWWQRTEARKKLLEGAEKMKLSFLTTILAWLLHFSYMSIIFIFVATDNFAQAIEYIGVIFGVGA